MSSPALAKVRRARERHLCDWCKGPIFASQKYVWVEYPPLARGMSGWKHSIQCWTCSGGDVVDADGGKPTRQIIEKTP